MSLKKQIEEKLNEKKIQHFFEVMQSIRTVAKEFEYFSSKTIETI